MSQKGPEELVNAWLAGDLEGALLYDACYENPEAAWIAILKILERDLTTDQMALLAAGPLENLLAQHGAAFIDRVEEQAKNSSRFNHLLGGVWRQDMPAEIWSRNESARKEAC